jgi:hypothetical protein
MFNIHFRNIKILLIRQLGSMLIRQFYLINEKQNFQNFQIWFDLIAMFQRVKILLKYITFLLFVII